MTTIGQISVAFVADTKRFNKGVDKAKGQLADFSSEVTGSSSILTKFTKRAGLAGAALAALGGLKWGVQLAMQAETAQTALRTVLGSQSEAAALIKKLEELSTKTPLAPTAVIDAGKKLAAFGFEAKKIPETLRRIGDVSTSLGIPLGELAEIYGKAQVQGRLFAEDINQLTGRGIPITREFAKKFDDVRKAVEGGKVGFSDLEAAFVSMTSKGGPFFKGMENASKDLKGLWSTLAGNVAKVAKGLGNELLPILKAVVKQTNRLVVLFAKLQSFAKTRSEENRFIGAPGARALVPGEPLFEIGEARNILERAPTGQGSAIGLFNRVMAAVTNAPSRVVQLQQQAGQAQIGQLVNRGLPRNRMGGLLMPGDLLQEALQFMGAKPSPGEPTMEGTPLSLLRAFIPEGVRGGIGDLAVGITDVTTRIASSLQKGIRGGVANNAALKGSQQAERIIAERRRALEEQIPQKQLEALNSILGVLRDGAQEAAALVIP